MTMGLEGRLRMLSASLRPKPEVAPIIRMHLQLLRVGMMTCGDAAERLRFEEDAAGAYL